MRSKAPGPRGRALWLSHNDIHIDMIRKWHCELYYNERIDPWLQVLWDKQGSDLLLVSGSTPRVRVDGGLRPLENAPVLTGAEITELVAQHVDSATRRPSSRSIRTSTSHSPGTTRPGFVAAPSTRGASWRWRSG